MGWGWVGRWRRQRAVKSITRQAQPATFIITPSTTSLPPPPSPSPSPGQGEDTSKYLAASERLAAIAGPAHAPDRAWAESVDAAAAGRAERLEGDLAGYKANLVKEAIRLAHTELGDLHYARGDLQVGLWEGGVCVGAWV